jgi:hypothetical protein
MYDLVIYNNSSLEDLKNVVEDLNIFNKFDFYKSYHNTIYSK